MSSITKDDINAILFKKYIGFANSNKDTDISNEIPESAVPYIYSTRIYSNIIPSSGPPFDYKNKLNDTTIFTKTDITDGIYSYSKYKLVSNTHIVYYKDIVLTGYITNPNKAFIYKDVQNNILTRAINTNSGSNKYDITVTYNYNGTYIVLPEKDYIFDRDAGVLTIYSEDYSKELHGVPRISFWRYEGEYLDNKLASIDTSIANIKTKVSEPSGGEFSIAGISGESPFPFTQIKGSIAGDINAVSFNTVSDINTKTNISELSLNSSIELISRLRPVEYNFKNDLYKKRFGFIAQDVAELLEGKNIGIHNINSEGLQSLNYSELIAPMISVIQKLYRENLELDKRVKALEEGFVCPIEEISEAVEVGTEKKKKSVSRFIPFLRKK